MNYFDLTLLFGQNGLSLKGEDYNEDLFAHLRDSARARMHSFDSGYGPYLVQHSQDVADELSALLRHLGYDAKTAKILGDDAFFHDLGKTHKEQEGLWRISEQKIVPTPREEQERPKHAALGPAAMDELLASLNLDLISLRPIDRERILRINHLQTDHHIRFDKKPDMNVVMRALCVVDTLSGKKKAVTNPVANQDPALEKQTIGKAYSKLVHDQKHKGQLDPVTLSLYGESLLKQGKIAAEFAPAPAGLANPAIS